MLKTMHRKGRKFITLFLSLFLSFNTIGICYAEGEGEQPVSEDTLEVEENPQEESQEIASGNNISVVENTDDNNNYGAIISDYADDVPSYISDFSTNTNNSIPSSYQLDKSKYPDVRDQGSYGTCWAFAALGLSEFSLINKGLADKKIDLSELQLAYFTYNSVVDPLDGTTGDQSTYYDDTDYNYLNRGGMYEYAVRRLSQWSGVVNESDVPYTTENINNVLNNGLSSEYAYSKDVAHLKNAYVMSLANNTDDVKRAIMEYGAVGVQYYHSDSYLLWNSNQQLWTYYSPTATGGGHNVMIVGWDDDFSKDNFVGDKPSNNGAWLIRNSWGFTQSYFWMSYENASLLDSAWAFEMDSEDNYDNNYQLDGGIDTHNVTSNICAYKTYSNIFTVQNKDGVTSENLEAVSLSFTHVANVNYKIEIYTDLDPNNPYPNNYYGGTKQESATTTGTTTSAGLYTIPLEKSVQLTPGSTFAVVVTTDSYALDYEQGISWENDGTKVWDAPVSLETGKSFYGTSTNQWPWYWGNFCIKAFTTNNTHTWDAGTITKESTCTEHGQITYTCTDVDCSETKTEELPYANHKWNEGIVTKEPTCTESGIKTYTCTECKETKIEDIASKGHTWTTKRIDPTCANTGKEYQECMTCGAHSSENVINALGHDYKKVETVDSTCTKDGYQKYQCTRGDDSYTTTIAKKSHNYQLIDTKDSTCTNKGYHKYRCTTCGNEYTTYDIASKGHAWVTKRIDPTCTSAGKEYQECTRCGAHGTERTINALGHSWYVAEIHDSTCTNDGYKKYQCSRCSESYTVKIDKKGHSWSDWYTVEAATSSKEGKERRTCNRCGQVEERSISKLYVEKVAMYRLYNPYSGEHFYTSNKSEKNNLTKLGWKYEGVGWNAPKYSNYPVYRIYNPVGGEHHYTLSVDEKNNLVRLGWKDEGIGWYSAEPNSSDSIPVKREYNPYAFANNHNYTISLDEHNWLVGLGWKDEGTGWYALR